MKRLKQMLKKNKWYAAAGFAAIAVGCGSGMSGTYSVSQSMVGGFGNCPNPQFNMSISQSGSQISASGTATNCTGVNETLQGTDNGATIDSVSLVVTFPSSAQGGSQYGYNPYGTYNPYGQGGSTGQNTTCTYTGSLSHSGSSISGTLSLQNTGTGTGTGSSGGYYGYNPYYSGGTSSSSGCAQSVTLNGTIK